MSNDERLVEEIWRVFSEQQHVFLATADADQPRVRPVTLIHLRDRLFVATGSSDAKVNQIKQNQKTEFCLLLEQDGKKGTLRAECEAQIVEDKEVKTHIYEKIAFLKEFWGSPEDLSYTLIELTPSCFEYMKPGSMEAARIRASREKG